MLECFMVRASEPSSDLGIGCGLCVVVVGADVVSWLPDLWIDCDVMGQKMVGYTLAGPLANLRLMLYLCKYWTEPAS